MRRYVIALLAFAVLPLVAHADSRTPGFQLQADGLAFSPMGRLDSQDADASSLFATGGGWALTATVGISPHWLIGLRAASYRSTKGGSYTFTELPSTPEGSGPFRVERELRLLPIHGILQYRRSFTPVVEMVADAGLGVLSTTDHMSLFSNLGHGELSSIAGYQKDASWSLGLGLAFPVPANLDLVAGARYTGTFTTDGAVWLKGDDPGFANWTLGLRYPHNTH